jgi:DNA helicase-2/ATP-dependent DNA helicase PcrA
LREAGTGHADGREVEVATYHSFAASLLDEFGTRMGQRMSGVLMDDGHRFELAGRVLRSLPDTPLDLTKLSSLRKDVLMVSDGLNDNLLDASTVRAAAPSELDSTWETRLALLDAAEAFGEAKARLGLIEYSDLIRRAVDLVQRHPDVAVEVASRYDTVLLDEYQDTDRAQRALLRAIFAGRVPVTAVGDTDQTIYEWRGASIQNFEGFPSDFPTPSGGVAPTLPLSINRRSDRRILDLANGIRSEIPAAEGSEPLTPRDGAGDGEVVTAWFTAEREEAAWIASEMARRYDEGVPYADMAVLCRRRDSFKVITEELRRAGIPFVVSSTSDLLQVPQ